MDTIKFKLFEDPIGGIHADILVNGTSLPTMIAEQEKILYEHKIMDEFSGKYAGLPPDDLLEQLLSSDTPAILGDTDWAEYGYKLIWINTYSTDNSIVWDDFSNPRRVLNVEERKRAFDLGNPLDPISRIGLDFPSLRFEFDKEQYDAEIKKLINNTLRVGKTDGFMSTFAKDMDNVNDNTVIDNTFMMNRSTQLKLLLTGLANLSLAVEKTEDGNIESGSAELSELVMAIEEHILNKLRLPAAPEISKLIHFDALPTDAEIVARMRELYGWQFGIYLYGNEYLTDMEMEMDMETPPACSTEPSAMPET
ncbi:hypothetical protein AGMMS49982_13180 [Bacteroidia bacterium]|nr:hypothetical protein AGMMS49982_13180 [Bacteroidia bacterium]